MKIRVCPFCGCKAALKTLDEGGPVRFVVTCSNEHCSANGPTKFKRDEAISRWNYRVSDR